MQTARKSTRGRAPLVGGAYVFRNQQEETRESAHRSVQLTNTTDQVQPASTTDQLQTTQTEGEEIDLNFDPNNKLKWKSEKSIYKDMEVLSKSDDLDTTKSEYLVTSIKLINKLQDMRDRIKEKFDDFCDKEKKKRKRFIHDQKEKKCMENRIKKHKISIDAIQTSSEIESERLECCVCTNKEAPFGVAIFEQPCCNISLCTNCMTLMEMENRHADHNDALKYFFYSCPSCRSKIWTNCRDSKNTIKKFEASDSYEKKYDDGIYHFVYHQKKTHY